MKQRVETRVNGLPGFEQPAQEGTSLELEI